MMLGVFPSLAKTSNLPTASSFPTISLKVTGRYFSTLIQIVKTNLQQSHKYINNNKLQILSLGSFSHHSNLTKHWPIFFFSVINLNYHGILSFFPLVFVGSTDMELSLTSISISCKLKEYPHTFSVPKIQATADAEVN